MVMPVKYWISILLALIAAAVLLAASGCGGSGSELGQPAAAPALQGQVLRDASGLPKGVRLTWPVVDDPNVSGYHVYWSADPIPDSARGDDSFWLTLNSSTLVNQPSPPAATVQVDYVPGAVVGEVWHFRLTAVDNGGSESHLSGQFDITIQDYEILSVDPLSAGVNHDVTVGGQFFGSYNDATDEVKFAGVNWVPGTGFEPARIIAPVISWTPSEILARVPMGATSGTVDVDIDMGSKTSTQVFTNSDPYITDISTLSGIAGDVVTLTGNNFGSGFDAGHRVALGTTLLLNDNDYVSYTNTEIEFVIPDGPLGNQSVRVRVGLVDSNEAFLTVEQAPGPVWEHTWGETGIDLGAGVVTDDVGDVYMAGSSSSFHTPFSDALVMKYSGSGAFRWARVWDNTDLTLIADRVETVEDVCIDTGGNLYLIGSTHDASSKPSILLLKFNSFGDFQYARNWTADNAQSSAGAAICTDDTYLYIASILHVFDTGELQLLKYRTDGTLESSYMWPLDTEVIASDIAIDSNGDLVVTGFASDVLGGSQEDAFLLKVDGDFTLVWGGFWGGSETDIGNGLYINDADEIYMVGTSSSFDAVAKIAQPFMAVYAADGTLQSSYSWPLPNTSSFLSIDESASGKFYCVGGGVAQYPIIYYALLGDSDSGYGVENFRAYTHPQTQPNALDAWTSAGDDLFICGFALKRGGVWSDVSVATAPIIPTTAIEPEALVVYDGLPSTLNGTTTNVIGVENTGGGSSDALIIKYNPE